MPMFSIPLSGLDAASSALSVISNNLSNLNTTGYKSQEASFKDLFYQNIGETGSGDPIQMGAGTAVNSISTDFTDGSLTTTGVDTDAAITGNGFFVTELNGAVDYTRDGQFTTNTAGQLVTQDGQSVMGYSAVNGVIPPGQALAPIVLGQGLTSPPLATANFSLDTNLDASANVGDTFSTPIAVYDSLGVSHTLTFQFTKTGANAWSYNATIPAADVGATGAPVSIANGNLTFNGSGVLTSPTGSVTGIALNNLADGANNMSLNWNLFDSNNNPLVGQVASPSATTSTTQDGYSSGTLLNFNIGSDGVIQGTFSNGKTTPVAQIALATFANEQGLQRVGTNDVIGTLSSGAPVVGTPGTGARGTLTGGALEQSNADIATQFADMIVAQRGFQANAKVVTTLDEITQNTIDLIR